MKKVKKKVPLSRLKKKLWKVFSLWVRLRGADQSGYNVCVTCGSLQEIKDLHAGHYIHGHSKSSFLDEYNVHPQCVKCNHFLSGNLLEYHDYMLRKYGQNEIDRVKTLSKQIWKPSRSELESLYQQYSAKKDLK